jgi:threonine synthase
MAVADRLRSPVTPMVALATAHPAKFPDAVEAATGKRPAMPPRLAALEDKEEQYVTFADDIAALERLVESHAQAARLEA